MSKQFILVIPQLHRRGGQERSTHEVVVRLLERGWKVTVLSFVCDDIEHENMKWVRVWGLSAPSEFLRNFIFAITSTLWVLFSQHKVPVVTIGVSTWIADIRVIQFFHTSYRRLVKSNKATFPKAGSFVQKVYQNFYSFYNSALEKVLLKRSKVLAISKTVAGGIQAELGVEVDKIVHHGVDETNSDVEKSSAKTSGQSAFNEKSLPSSEKCKILFVGALERKGIAKALRVLRRIPHKNWHFHVVGDGNVSQWKNAATEYGLNDEVSFYGARPSQPYFASCDVFFFPSQYEPFGLVVSEAFSHGLAVLASTECGAMELWPSRPEELSLSIDDSDEKWACGLSQLIDNSQYRKQVAEQAWSEVSQWSWDCVTDEYESLILQSWRKN